MNKLYKFTFKLFKRPSIKLDEVFTPATAAGINYIERYEIDSLLSSEMSTPGKQIIVFGHSGSGKTSSVRNLLIKNKYHYIKTHCESNTTFEQLILNAFDELNIFVVSEKSLKRTSTIKGELANEYNTIRANLNSELSQEDSHTLLRLLPPQLTPQKLSRFMGEGKIVWLIEDFQKVSSQEKNRIADVIKIFVDNANDYPISKIICIGACQFAHELLTLDPNLRTRVSEVYVPLLNDEEIKEIILNGFSLLNVVPNDSLVEKLVYYSDRLGAFAHEMCLDICKGENITHTSFRKRYINDSSFQYAIDGFIKRRSDTLKSIYEAAVKNELGWYVLNAFSHTEKDKLSFNEIFKQVNHGRRSFSKEMILEKIEELMTPSFSIIYYNANSERYALSTPFWHRFLRLQLSLERSVNRRNKKNNKNPNLQLISDDLKYQIVDQSLYKLIKKLHELKYTK